MTSRQAAYSKLLRTKGTLDYRARARPAKYVFETIGFIKNIGCLSSPESATANM